jgi:hypothetical protein
MRRLIFVPLLLLIMTLLPGVLLAHGGGTPVLTNAEAGPYRIFVWANPEKPVAGVYHLTVAVSEPAAPGKDPLSGEPVLHALVQVTFQHLESGDTITMQATHENAVNKLLYEGDAKLPKAGQWRVDVTVQGPQGQGSAGYVVELADSRTINWLFVVGGVLGILFLAGLVLVLQRRLGSQAADGPAAQRLEHVRSLEK